MVPTWVAELMPSDWLMFAFAGLLLYFVLDYGLLTPWWKAPVSFFVLWYALAMAVLMVLIIYGTVAGQRIDEWARIPAWAALCIGMLGKIVVLKFSRYQGRIERRRLAGLTSERISMDPKTEAVAKATTIWYVMQRVVRTLVQTAIPSFLTFALVLPSIIEAMGLPVESELRLWLIGLAAGITAVAGAISRVMAIPAVNAWLIKLNLGSVPKDAVVVAKQGDTALVKADLKAFDRG